MVFSRRTLSGIAVFTALVAAATMVFSVYVPATRGFFNVGEIMVYTSALLMGPIVGGVAGGVGSMIADVALGYYHFAPATLLIKGAEGFMVGYIFRKSISYFKNSWKVISAIMATAVGLLIGAIGANFYTGDVEISLGLPPVGYQTVFLSIPLIFWVAIAILAFTSIVVTGIMVDSNVGWPVISVFSGGIIMILGYYIYEIYLFGAGAALLEIPINIGQMIIGLIVAIPLTRSVSKLLKGRLQP